jgi:hypothetical protein
MEIGNLVRVKLNDLPENIQKFAGKFLTISCIEDTVCGFLGVHELIDKMYFDVCEGPLPAKDAIHLMLDEDKELYDRTGNKYYWNETWCCFIVKEVENNNIRLADHFNSLFSWN